MGISWISFCDDSQGLLSPEPCTRLKGLQIGQILLMKYGGATALPQGQGLNFGVW